jgi:6-phosphofructokinase
MKNVFLSFNLKNEKWFVGRVYMYLKRQPDLQIFCYEQQIHYDRYAAEIERASREASYFIFFHGREIGDYQAAEANDWFQLHGKSPECHRLIVELPGAGEWHYNAKTFRQGVDPIKITVADKTKVLNDRNAYDCASEIARCINGRWIPYDGLPERYIFHYEKDIIEQFALPGNTPEERFLMEGCPDLWPEVTLKNGLTKKNPLDPDEIGSFRSPSDTVLVDVRSKYHKPANPKSEACGNICCLVEKGLTFLEAGPREELLYGHDEALNVGILVTGGIAPGINSVIAGIVERHSLYWKEQKTHPLYLHCYLDGFCGLLEGRRRLINFVREGDENPQNSSRLATILDNANAGGAVLGTSRLDEMSNLKLLEKRSEALNSVLTRLWTDKIDILYIIGGDGSMKAAHALNTLNNAWSRNDPYHRDDVREISIIGIPKTMDNDILWVWQSFGFMSAVEKASECLRLLHTEATSNPRLAIIQLFGSDSGFTVSHAALASLQCDAALIPEISFNMDWLFNHIKGRLKPRLQITDKQRSPYGMIVMAETAVPDDWYCYVNWNEHLERIDQDKEKFIERIKDEELKVAIDNEIRNPSHSDNILDLSRQEVEAIITFIENKRRVYGQTPDALRTVSLRLVSQVLQYRIQNEMGKNKYWKSFRVFTSEPRHLLRSSPPSANDIIIGRRFGTLAVDNAMAGYSDFMISQWLTEYVLVPLSLVVLGRKRVPRKGIFWKSVLAKTGQQDITRDDDVSNTIGENNFKDF